MNLPPLGHPGNRNMQPNVGGEYAYMKPIDVQEGQGRMPEESKELDIGSMEDDDFCQMSAMKRNVSIATAPRDRVSSVVKSQIS